MAYLVIPSHSFFIYLICNHYGFVKIRFVNLQYHLIAGFLTLFLFPVAREIRVYLASHSDRKIDEFFERVLLHAIGAIAPTIFLTSECIGCVTLHGGLRECYAMMSSQFVVLSNIMFGYIFVLFSDFTHAHVSWEEIVCLNGTSITVLMKILVQGATTIIAFVVYGMKEVRSHHSVYVSRVAGRHVVFCVVCCVLCVVRPPQ